MDHRSNRDFFYRPKQLTDLSPSMRPGTTNMPPQVLASGTTPLLGQQMQWIFV